MTTQVPRTDSLVLYHNHPARVLRSGDKLLIQLTGGEQLQVRTKDVTLLHPGPSQDPDRLRAPTGEPLVAWEIMAGETTTLPELASLAFGAFTPETAWATWQLIAEGLYFRGTPDRVNVASVPELEQRKAARDADAAERNAWKAFADRARAGRSVPEDARYLRDVEAVALGRAERSRVLAEFGRDETPEGAHALLLDTGWWTPRINPYPARLELSLTAPGAAVPELPDEPRLDLTAHLAYAIDDASTDTPDDALSYDGERLWVHVADASALIPPGSELDLLARERGAALYLPEGQTPMVPPAVIAELGLGIQPVSPALSFALTVAPTGELEAVELFRTRLRVERLTYDEAGRRIAEDPFRSLHALAQRVHARRVAAGSREIELPETDVKLRGDQIEFHPVLPGPARLIVEEAMILAGEAAARWVTERGIAAPFATQEAAIEDAPPLGSGLAAMWAARKGSFPRRYRSGPGPHAGLGLSAYSQATSPLRRYLDLVLHQQVSAHLRGEPALDQAAILERIGSVEPLLAATRRAEWRSDLHWTLVYLLEHPGWRGEGVLVERRGQRGTVLLPDLVLEASLHLQGDLPLDSVIPLECTGIDLPRLDSRWRVAR